MKAYQGRVIEELVELENKRRALRKFIDSEAFPAVEERERVRMQQQLSVMSDYASILWDRIWHF